MGSVPPGQPKSDTDNHIKIVGFSDGQPLNLPTIISIIPNKHGDEVGDAILMCTKMLFYNSRPQLAVAPSLTLIRPGDIGERSTHV